MMEALSASQHQEELRPYVEAGIKRAEKLGNRGPVQFGSDGKLTEDILEAFWRTGFYVFENLVDADEIRLLQSDMQSLLDRAPVDNRATTDRLGRPAFGQEFARQVYSLVRPLADPWGGTSKLNGRSPSVTSSNSNGVLTRVSLLIKSDTFFSGSSFSTAR